MIWPQDVWIPYGRGEGNKKLLGCCLIFSSLCYTREYHRINICRYNLNWILQTGLKTEIQKHALTASLLGFKLISVMFGWCFKQPSVNSGKHRWLPVSNCYTVGITHGHACVHTNTHKDEWLWDLKRVNCLLLWRKSSACLCTRCC